MNALKINNPHWSAAVDAQLYAILTDLTGTPPEHQWVTTHPHPPGSGLVLRRDDELGLLGLTGWHRLEETGWRYPQGNPHAQVRIGERYSVEVGLTGARTLTFRVQELAPDGTWPEACGGGYASQPWAPGRISEFSDAPDWTGRWIHTSIPLEPAHVRTPAYLPGMPAEDMDAPVGVVAKALLHLVQDLQADARHDELRAFCRLRSLEALQDRLEDWLAGAHAGRVRRAGQAIARELSGIDPHDRAMLSTAARAALSVEISDRHGLWTTELETLLRGQGWAPLPVEQLPTGHLEQLHQRWTSEQRGMVLRHSDTERQAWNNAPGQAGAAVARTVPSNEVPVSVRPADVMPTAHPDPERLRLFQAAGQTGQDRLGQYVRFLHPEGQVTVSPEDWNRLADRSGFDPAYLQALDLDALPEELSVHAERQRQAQHLGGRHGTVNSDRLDFRPSNQLRRQLGRDRQGPWVRVPVQEADGSPHTLLLDPLGLDDLLDQVTRHDEGQGGLRRADVQALVYSQLPQQKTMRHRNGDLSDYRLTNLRRSVKAPATP